MKGHAMSWDPNPHDRSSVYRRSPLITFALLLSLTGGLCAQSFEFMRGDANQDLKVDLADHSTVFGSIVFPGAVTIICDDAADANDDGAVNLADSIYIIQYLWLFGPAPPAPGELLGFDSTIDELTCDGPVGPSALPTIDHVYSISSVTGMPGTTQIVEVSLEIPAGSTPSDGWSYTVTHDPSVATVIGGDPGSLVTEYFFSEVVANGIVQLGVMDLLFPFDGNTIPEGLHSIATISYTLTGSDGDVSTLSFADTPISMISIAEGLAYTTETNPGSIEISATGPDFVRGECNGDGVLDIGDAIFALTSLFTPGADNPPCTSACDASDDGGFDIGDAVAILSRLFTGTPPLPPPSVGGCGQDPTPDTLTCVGPTACP